MLIPNTCMQRRPLNVHELRRTSADYINDTCKRSDAEKVMLKVDMLLEAANFRNKRRWFSSDVAVESALKEDAVDFWTVATEMKEAPNVGNLAQLLLRALLSESHDNS